MEPLVRTEWQPKLSSVVSLKHLPLNDVLVKTTKPFQSESVPPDNSQNVLDHDYSMEERYVKMCRICFATDNMYSMTSFRVLKEAYESLTGIMIAEEDHLPRYLCSDCADRLMNCARFRRRSLQAHRVLLDVARKHGNITVDLVHSEIKINNPFSSDSTSSPNDELSGTNNKELEKVNMLADKQCGSNPKDAYEINNIKTEIDNEIDSNNCEDEIDVVVNDIKTENEDYENQQDFNTGQPGLDESIVESDVAARKFDIFNQHNHAERSGNLDEDIDLNEILAHNDMINRDDVSECSFTLEDINIDNSDKDTVNDEVTSKSLVYPATLFEDIVNNVLLVVYNTVLNEDNPKVVNSFSEHMEYGHSFKFVGEDVLAGCLPSQKVRLEAKRVSKASQGSNEMNIHNRKRVDKDNKFSTDLFRCEICHYKTRVDIELLEHLKSHAIKSYQCDICVFNTNDKRKFMCHIRRYHGKKNYLCNICMEVFQSSLKLKLHLKIHNDKTHLYNICKKKFKHKSRMETYLKNHVKEKSCIGEPVAPWSVF